MQVQEGRTCSFPKSSASTLAAVRGPATPPTRGQAPSPSLKTLFPGSGPNSVLKPLTQPTCFTERLREFFANLSYSSLACCKNEIKTLCHPHRAIVRIAVSLPHCVLNKTSCLCRIPYIIINILKECLQTFVLTFHMLSYD